MRKANLGIAGVLVAAATLGPPTARAQDVPDIPLAEIVQIDDEMAAGILEVGTTSRSGPDIGVLNQIRLMQAGASNHFTVAQEGAGNYLEGSQTGGANTAHAIQRGNDNAAWIEQDGNNNTANALTQIGDGHVAVWRQLGDNLGGLSITQTPGAPPVSVTQR